MTPYPIDIGKFTTKMLEEILPKYKDELGIDFSDIIVYPGPQPRESADIELIKDNEIVGRINVKTSVTGDLRTTLRKLVSTIKTGELGAVIIFTLCYKDEENAEVRLIIALIPEEILKHYRIEDIMETIYEKMDAKAKEEHFSKIEPLALNDALELERTRTALEARDMAEVAGKEARKAREMAEEARKAADEAREEAKKAYEMAEKAKKAADEAREEAKKAYEMAEKAKKEAEKIREAVERIEKLLKNLVEKL